MKKASIDVDDERVKEVESCSSFNPYDDYHRRTEPVTTPPANVRYTPPYTKSGNFLTKCAGHSYPPGLLCRYN